MIWCDAQKKGDCRISLPAFWLYLPYALPYRQLLFETSLSFCWNMVLQKECIEFCLNSFSNHFHCTILSLFLGLSLHIFLTDLKWINLSSILRLNEASFMYKNLDVAADSNVKNIVFDLRNMAWQRITRNGGYRKLSLYQA